VALGVVYAVTASGQSDGAGARRAMTLAQVLALAEQQRQSGRLAAAESLCRQVLQVTPDQAETLQTLGVIVYQSGRAAEGIDLVRKAIAAKENVASFHSNLCELLRRADRLEEAVAAGRQAIALDPNLAQAHNNLGIAYFQKKEYAAAQECYRRALALTSDLAEVHSNLGNALQAEGKFDEAIEAHHKAIALRPEYAEGHNNLATALRLLRRYGEAETHGRRSLALNPQHAAAYNNLALCLIPQQRAEEALSLLSRSAQLDPTNPHTFVLLASLLSKRKEHDKAKAACERALALDPSHPEALNVLGVIAFDEGRAEEAILYYRKALELAPWLAHGHNNLASALKELGRLEEARAAYQAALRNDPHMTSAYVALADMHRFTPGDSILAAMERVAGSTDPRDGDDQIELHFALGKAYADLKQYERSFRHLLTGNTGKRREVDYDERRMFDLFGRIRDTFSVELLRTKAGAGDPSQAPVLIVGMPRSGTTLIEQILASHPKVFGADELHDLSHVIAAHCDLAPVPAAYPECIRDMPGEGLQRLGAAYAGRLRRRAPTAERITDKMPVNFLHLGLVHLALPNARIIHTRRDPVDTCWSCYARLFGGEQQFAYDLGELGRYYRRYETLMAHWRGILPPGTMFEIDYELVVDDLEQQARRIIAYCGLEWDDACLRFYETERPVRTSSAAQVRQPIYRSSIGRWRPYRQWLGPLLGELGIEHDPEKWEPGRS
jgi:tetratricopeptide (TPR) repeat protein